MDMHIASVAEHIAPISNQIWDAKYRLKTAEGEPVDLTIEDSWRRVARALAAAERQPELWEQPFYEALQDSASCRPAASCPVPGRTAG